jgi:hypothetical protein
MQKAIHIAVASLGLTLNLSSRLQEIQLWKVPFARSAGSTIFARAIPPGLQLPMNRSYPNPKF